MHTAEQRAAEQRVFLRDLALLLGLPLVAIVGLVVWWAPWKPAYEAPEGSEVFAVAAGTWDWTTSPADSVCVARRHSIAFTPDRRVMTITQSEPWTDDDGAERQVAVYDLSESSRAHVRGLIRGEARLTDAGEPVAWDLELTSADSYRWRRTDLPRLLGRTAEIRRCPEGTPPAVAGERDAAGLGTDTRLLDSLASGMTAEGWRRLGPDDCLAEECRPALGEAPREPYVASADFDGDGWLDLAMALTDGRRDYVVHFQGDGERRGFQQPGMVMQPEAGLRRSSLEVGEGPSLEVVNWERRWVSGPFRWDAGSRSLQYAPRAQPASEGR
jgi:hypothetical protein